MATRTCPNCGTQYIATVRRCIDCELNLVDDVETAPAAAETAPAESDGSEGRMAELALAGWGNQLKVTLEGMLDRAEIPHAWEAGALVLPRAHLAEAEGLIAVVEGSDVSDIGESTTMIALEIEGLDAAGLELLDGRLAATSVPHAWTDEGELLVAEADEDQVLELIQEVFDEEDEDHDGLDVAQNLTDLYVAVDRLIKKRSDPKLVAAFVAAAETMGRAEVPYGLDGEAWAALTESTRRLAGEMAGEPADPGDDGDGEAESGADGEDVDDADPSVADERDLSHEDVGDELEALRETLRELV